MSIVSRSADSRFIDIQWPAPANVHAVVTTRLGGVSESPYDSNNLAFHVGDKSLAVEQNREATQSGLFQLSHVQWLEQIHGVKVVEAQTDGRVRTADACITSAAGLACAVMTADCLPLLICDQAGTQVAAVHAGWRGLADGIITNTVAAFDAFPDQLLVYLGPAIGADYFEVGIDVLEAFYERAINDAHAEAMTAAFAPSATRPMKYLANIYALAIAELTQLGVDQIYGGDSCTYKDSRRFYSYRRDGVTGRMASLIWLS